ncbi:MAG: hypothetical protein ABR525_11675, partial [Candidatus Limnocylindria bacterium]
KALEAAELSIDEIDLVELNEAFASQSLACARELGIDEQKLNVNGGAIALGHPLGCSGARLMTSLVWEMRRRRARYGLVTLCVGVGQGPVEVFRDAGDGGFEKRLPLRGGGLRRYRDHRGLAGTDHPDKAMIETALPVVRIVKLDPLLFVADLLPENLGGLGRIAYSLEKIGA